MAAKDNYFKHPGMRGGQGYIPGKKEQIKDTGPSHGKLHKALFKQKLFNNISYFPFTLDFTRKIKHKHLHFVLRNTLRSLAENCCL